MQWWSWAGKNSDSCVPSETRPKGGKQEAMGKGWGRGTRLHGETYKILNFPTMRRERRAALPFTPHPCRLPQAPVHITRRHSGSQAKARGAEGGLIPQGHQPRAPSSSTDPTYPGAGMSSAKDKPPPYRTRTHTYVYMYTHTHTEAYIHKYTRIFREGREMGWDVEEKSANCLQSLLSNSLCKGLNP